MTYQNGTITSVSNSNERKQKPQVFGGFDDEFEISLDNRPLAESKGLGKAGTLINFLPPISLHTTAEIAINTLKTATDAGSDLVLGDIMGIEPKKEEPKNPEQQAKDAAERHRVINFKEERDKRLKSEPKAVRVDGEVMPATQVIDMLGLNSATDITDEKGDLKAYYEIAVSNAISFNDAVRQREARKIIASPGKKNGAVDSLDKAGESKNHYTQVAG